MNILITGVAGGIGSHLAKYFINKGHNCDGLDNFSFGREENIENLNLNNFYEFDISSPEGFNAVNVEYDLIVHLAAVSSLPYCELEKKQALESNLIGTLNTLEFARKNNSKHFIFGSTSAVYENNNESKLTEDLDISPDLVYPLTKKFSEDLMNSYMKNYSMNICILRFFNVLSSNQDFNRVSPPLLNYIVREIIHRRVPVLHGSGEQKRDFVHINDVLEMIDLVVKNNSTGVFNVCSGKNISINEIYAKTAKILQSDIVPRYESAEMLWDNYQELFIGGNSLDKVRVEDEVLKSSSGSYRKAQEKLGWEPHTNFESLFKETVENISAEVRTYFEI